MNYNLSDPKEVKRAQEKEDLKRKQELNDIRTVLSNASGKRFVWRLLAECGTFRTVYSPDHSVMSRLSGKQDLGHFLMAEITNADNNLLLKMMRDNLTGEKDGK